MTNDDYSRFVKKYVTMRVGAAMDIEFVIAWRPKLDHVAIDDLLGAVEDLAADPEAKFPLNDLPLLLSHIEERQYKRRPRFKDPINGLPKLPPPSTAWNKTMLESGVITKSEFNRRERERERDQ